MTKLFKRIVAVTAAMLVAPLLTLPVVAAPAQAAEQAINDGYVIWGYKESWRNYVSDHELSGGVTKLPSGEFKWPIASGTYDPDTKTTVLNLAGKVRFKSYCDSSDKCMLDSTFENLKIEISSKKQLITGTYSGRKRSNPSGPIETETNKEISDLDIYNNDPAVSGGETTWTEIPGYVMEDGLYPEGTEMDPVTIHYTGDGGKPDLAERFDEQGIPQFTEAAHGVVNSRVYGRRAVNFLSADKSKLYAAAKSYSNGGSLNVIVLDAKTLQPIAEGKYPFRRLTAITYDSNSGTVMASRSLSGGAERQITIAKYNETSGQVEFSDVATLTNPQNLSMGGGSLFFWDGSKLITDMYIDDPALPAEERHKLYTVTPGASGTPWTVNTANLLPPAELTGKDKDTVTRSTPEIRTAENFISLAADSFVLSANRSTQYDAAGTEITPRLQTLRKVNDTTWQLEYIPGTEATDYSSYGSTDGYSFITQGPGDSYILSGSNRKQAFGTMRVENGTFTVTDTQIGDPAQNSSLYHYNQTADAAIGFAGLNKEFFVFRNGEYAGKTQAGILPLTGANLFDAGDDAYIGQVYGDPSKSYARLEMSGMTPLVTTDPSDETVSLVNGDTEGKQQLSVDYKTIGDVSVQWQKRLPGEKKFKNIDSATGKTLDLTVSLDDDQSVYRAVLENASGKVVSKEATLTVQSAPRFSETPRDFKVFDGKSAKFTAALTPDIAGDIAWEKQDAAGAWQPVVSGSGVTVNGGELTIDATKANDGELYRAVASNSVGTNPSDPVKLTVEPAVKIPAKGLSYSKIVLEWDGNRELQRLSPAGTANYFSAGKSTGKPGEYKAKDGNVEILHEMNGKQVPASYATRKDFIGKGRQLVKFSEGVATVMPDGSGRVSWKGAWTVNMYDGMAPFTVTNPYIEVASDGTGVLKANLSGPTGATPGSPATGSANVDDVVISTFKNVEFDVLNGMRVTPDYAGVKVDVSAPATPQNRTVKGWGAWPQSFVDYQVKTGLSSYWYSSGSSFDEFKAPTEFFVNFKDAVLNKTINNNNNNGNNNGNGNGNSNGNGKGGSDGLAHTGSGVPSPAGVVGLLVLMGVGVLLMARSRRHDTTVNTVGVEE